MPDGLTLERSEALARECAQFRTFGHFINNEWVGGHGGATIELSNPATGELLGAIQAGDEVDIDRAVRAAHAAFPAWARSEPLERQRILLEIAARLRRRQAEFAMFETLNNGKPITDALNDVSHCITQFEYYAGAPAFLSGELLDFPDCSALVHREPVGVVAQIIPWNVPLVMTAMKLAPALAAGCTIVLKPAETVCLAVLEFIAEVADLLPRGVVNVVTGYGAAIGEALVAHPLVRKVAFTGSRATAQKIIQYASVNLIPQTMELGGKSANIVCEDADLDAAAESIVLTTIFNKGEVCLAGSRVFAHRRIHDALIARIGERIAKVRQGNPIDPATQLGAQASVAQFDRILSYIDLGRAEGAAVVHGGGRASVPGLDKGLFIQPTIFTGVRNDMRIAQEEIFGPVTGIIAWDGEEELIRQVNDSVYGLAGGLWTRNLARAHRLSRAMDTGTVWVNRYYNVRPGMPLGGTRQSGFGRESAFAPLEHYTHSKCVVVNLAEGEIGIFNH
ncbi:aldehyde dehydrogenase family protein [Sphingobium sp.]|uniref:aldehyde dehydrogenase family protein n=1 Tax=Sphingobium sp. TaxID=1912891 RepID=UPI0028BD78EA|nr:aldehyde dehydrogenase family protein [Sphingobium sp.]